MLFFLGTGHAYSQFTLSDMYVGFFAQDKDSFAAQDRWNFDFTYEHWLEKPNGLEQKPYSFGIGLNRMFDFSLTRNNSFAFGLGMHWLNHYSNARFISIAYNGERIRDSLLFYPSNAKYKVNKFVLHFIDLNAELRLRFGHERNVKLYLGFRGSYLIGNHTKYKDSSSKYKVYDIPGFSSINYGPTIRLGIGAISLHACYWLKPIFTNAHQQNITSFSAGLSFFFL